MMNLNFAILARKDTELATDNSLNSKQPSISNKQCGEKRRAARATLTQFTAGSHCSLITPLQSALHSTRMSREMSGSPGTPHSRPDNWVILAKRARRGNVAQRILAVSPNQETLINRIRSVAAPDPFEKVTRTINSTKQMCKITSCKSTT